MGKKETESFALHRIFLTRFSRCTKPGNTYFMAEDWINNKTHAYIILISPN